LATPENFSRGPSISQKNRFFVPPAAFGRFVLKFVPRRRKRITPLRGAPPWSLAGNGSPLSGNSPFKNRLGGNSIPVFSPASWEPCLETQLAGALFRRTRGSSAKFVNTCRRSICLFFSPSFLAVFQAPKLIFQTNRTKIRALAAKRHNVPPPCFRIPEKLRSGPAYPDFEKKHSEKCQFPIKLHNATHCCNLPGLGNGKERD